MDKYYRQMDELSQGMHYAGLSTNVVIGYIGYQCNIIGYLWFL